MLAPLPHSLPLETIKTDRQGCEDAKGFDAEATGIQDLGDDSWLNINPFPDITPVFNDSNIGVEYSQTGQGTHESGFDEI